MAWVAIPNSPDWEYDNMATAADCVGANGSCTSGIRTFTPTGGSVQLTYIKVRRVGDTADTSRGELSKSFWDARGNEDDIQPFDMTVRTTAANETFTIPAQNVGTFNATVDWGDGSSSTVTTYNTSNLTHTYASAGDHAISISGTLPNIYFNSNQLGDRLKVIAVTNLGQVGWQRLDRAFAGCDNMTSFTPGVTDTSSVTDMHQMFQSCGGLTSLDLSSFDTSNVTNMWRMIVCLNLTSLDVSGFNTSSVTDMHEMFYYCRNLPSITGLDSFDTSSVTDMNNMFFRNNVLTSLDLSNWDTSSVTNMYRMFYDCHALTTIDVSNWDTSSATNMSSMFYNCFDLISLDLSSFDTSSVTNMYRMFYRNEDLTSLDVSNWNTSSVTLMHGMFQQCRSLTSLDVSSFDTSSVTNMREMFRNSDSLTSLDLSNFDTSSVTMMYQMFAYCYDLTTLDVSNWDTSSVTSMGYMFQNLGSNNAANVDITGVENFNIEALNHITGSLNSFMIGVTLPTSRYDALLINWDAQDPLDNMTPNFGSSQYTAGGTAAAARANLISTDGWTISDGGTA